ncbi:MAG TPA: CBS domain-containing protein [Planctomycetota bacterium]|nr:CBS domain-containing protein [Planctomycetota bacterium]
MTQAIRDIMSRDIECASPESTVKDAASALKAHDIGSMPVCEGKRVVGIITDRDITIRAVAEGRDPGSTKVRDVMSKDIVSIREDADLKEAERLMRERQLRRLPVLNGEGNLVGYLAIARIARTESPEEAGKVLQGVSQPSKTK